MPAVPRAPRGRLAPGLRWALGLWTAFAIVVWNVVFDRRVYEASTKFTQQQIERFEAGQPVATIEAGFRPEVRRAALEASAWGGSVLAAGFVLTMVVNRRKP